MEDLWLKVKLWQWRILFVVIAIAILISVAYYFRWIEPPGVVSLILSTIIAIALGVFFTTRAKERRGRGVKIVTQAEYDVATDRLSSPSSATHSIKVTGNQWSKVKPLYWKMIVAIALGVFFVATRPVGGPEELVDNSSIEYLSSPSTAVRLKGVKTLYQRAKGTQDLSTKEKIWNLLNNHVQHYTQDVSYQKSFPQKPSADIQEAIDIQGRRGEHKESKTFLSIRTKASVNWSDAWLRGARLWEAQLQGANLTGTQLQEADLTEAQLQGANLWKAQLQRAYLEKAQLQEAYLERAQLQGADLTGAQLQGANLWKAQL